MDEMITPRDPRLDIHDIRSASFAVRVLILSLIGFTFTACTCSPRVASVSSEAVFGPQEFAFPPAA